MLVLLSIPIGLTLLLAVFMLLWKLFGLAAKAAALVVALLSLALYLPYALWNWPGADVVALHIAVFLVAAYALGLITAHREAGTAGGFHWAPTIIVIFFVVLVLFDAVLVVVATRGLPDPIAHWLLPQKTAQHSVSSAFPGVVANDFQKKEGLYNAYLEQVERQKARGWVVQKGWVGVARAGNDSLFQVTVLDRDGRPVTGAEVIGGFLRPSNTQLDQWFKLDETAPGQYQALLVLPAPGAWDLSLEIRRGDDLHQLKGTTSLKE